MHASNVFVCNFSRLVQELDLPVLGAMQSHDARWPLAPGIDKIQLDAPLAFAVAFATVLTMRPCLVALQMTLATGQAARPYTLWLAALTTIVAIGSIHRLRRDI